MDTWEEYESQGEVEGLAKMAEEYGRLVTQIDKLVEKAETLKTKIEVEFPADAGEFNKQAGSYMVTLNRQERWTWDKEILETIFSSSTTLPEFVRRTYSVDKRKFKSLDEGQQRELLPALTRKGGTVKISVKTGGLG
mgnify:CR=1 FL=1|jgi:hypothetical protein